MDSVSDVTTNSYEFGGLLCLVDHYGIDIAYDVLNEELEFVDNRDLIVSNLLIQAIDKLNEPLDDITVMYLHNVDKIEVTNSFLVKFTPLLEEHSMETFRELMLQNLFVNNSQIRDFSFKVPNFYKIIKKLADILFEKIVEHKEAEELLCRLPLDNISDVTSLDTLLDKEYFIFNDVKQEDLPFF